MRCNMSQDTIDYLKSIQERMLDYDDTRSDVLGYILENEIKDGELATHLFIMGFLLKAAHREEELSEQELNMLLGSDEETEYTFDLSKTFMLDESQTDLELDELLDLTVKNFSVD